MEPNLIPFPRKELLVTKAKLQEELARLREELLPYYEDDEEILDNDIKKAGSADLGAVGIMSAIAWCHGQIGVYKLLNDENPEQS